MLKKFYARACATTIAFTITLVTLLAVAGVNAPEAAAADAPITQRSATGVTADALPTAQINGVVWDQAIVGNTVYAGGQFTSARPPGSSAGTNESPRTNLMSYNLSTGALNSFAPSLNGIVYVLALSPDKSRLYVGGSFTSASGTQHNRIAAYDTATGQVINSFAPNLDARVLAITATNSAVYVGGWFSTANGNARSRLAAFNPTNGALLGWAPTADYDVNTLLITPDGSKVIVGGAFATINGSTAQGLGAVDPTTGVLIPWIANTVVKNYGTSAAQLSLKTDGTTIYGTGYWFGGTGNFEGVWAADQSSGAIKWLADCHGDTYDSTPVNGVVYSVSHHHNCENIASFPEQNPRVHWRADAFTADVKGTVRPNSQGGYFNFAGYGSPSQVNWFPDLTAGSFTGQTQAAWTSESDGDYVVLGGEFPKVNNTNQQGLVRFAVPSKAPKLQGNQIDSASSAPILKALSGAVKVSWPTNWDRDDALLTYQVRRSDKGSTPVYTATNVESLWWNRKTLSFIDNTVAPNTSYTYTIRENDPDGNVAFSASVPVTTGTGTFVESAYSQQVRADGAANYWKLNDPAGSNPSTDWTGTSDLTLSSGVTLGAAGAILGSTDTAGTFNGTTTGLAATATAINPPNVFTAEAWIKTTSTAGGKILGFGSAKTGASSSYDRHLYMDNTGRISFGVYPGAVKTVRAPAAYNDGQWHQVVATLSSAGMVLYVDGNNVGSDPTVTFGQTYTGYWRLGGDNLGSWPNAGTSQYLAGTIDDAAIYPTALTLAQVRDHYTKSGRSLTNNALPTAAFSNSCTEGACTFDASGSTDSDGTISSYAWTFGDGATATGVNASHTYTASGAYQVALTVTDNDGGTNTLTKTVNVTVLAANQLPTADFTVSCQQRVCSFDGSTSADADGTISTYAWTFGDGSTANTATANHTFAINGDYSVKLTVTDDRGGSGSKTKTVHAFNNASPTASFTATCTGLTCNVDASASADTDGTIASYAWTFGDNGTDTGVTASRTYAAGGTYDIKLTVTDNQGATDVQTKSVTVSAPQNQKPTAAFSSSVNNLALSFDASGSTDTDGTIASYQWTFGDGSTGTGATVSHTYAGTGWFSVKLTVTDNDGATDTLTKQVKAGEPIVAADGFARTATNSWGSADTGGAWSLSGSSSRMSVDGSVGKIKLEAPAVGTTASLNSVSTTDINVVSDIAFDKLGSGSGVYATQTLRRQTAGAYGIKLILMSDGKVSLGSYRTVNGTDTSIREIVVSGLTYAPGDVLRVRVKATGTSPTTLSAKVWKAGTAEPATAQLSVTDSTAALQSAGAYGIQGYLSGSATNAPVVVSVDNLLITAN